MDHRLIIGLKQINLKEVDSTNVYLKQLLTDDESEIEGLVVTSEKQSAGKGQKNNVWESEGGKNIICSILLKPKIEVKKQFLISKIISLGIIDFLLNLGLENVKIKWPNDIYYKDKKLAGVLIENSVKGNKIVNSIVGIGINVNQTKFHSDLINPASIKSLLNVGELNLHELFEDLLFFIEKWYLLLKTGKTDLINKEYLQYLHWLNESRQFYIDNNKVEGVIVGVSSTGMLQVELGQKTEDFDLNQITFIKD